MTMMNRATNDESVAAGDIKPTGADEVIWGAEVSRFDAFSRNVSLDYLVLGVQLAIGLVMLPFNVSRLGQSSYGLWVLAASITAYFSLFDLGYGVAQVKFAAEYRAKRDRDGLNQIVSTLFFLFAGIGIAVFGIATVIALNLERLFNVNAGQAATGKYVLLLISGYVAIGFPFSVFGGVVNGFQRHYLNGRVAIVTTIIVALVNLFVLLSGHGLIELVAATTSVRILSYFFYRLNAYRAFPGLRIRPRYFRLSRLREVTGLSVFLLLIDLANKLNYSADAIVIGAFLGTVAISIWAVAQRMIETTQSLTSQVNGALFPVVVDIATAGDDERLRHLLIQGTRLSLAMVVPVGVGLVMLAKPLVTAWVGPNFEPSVPIIYILTLMVALRVGCSMSTTVLKGAGQHRLLAASNAAAAAANVALSMALVRPFGLIGVALGTLLPLGSVCILVLLPAACRRVGLRLRQVFSKAVWPAVWPAVPMASLLYLTRRVGGLTLASIAIQAMAAGCVYAVIFFKLGIGRDEREWYASRIRQALRRWRPVTIQNRLRQTDG